MRTPPPLPSAVLADAVHAAHRVDASVFTFVRGGEGAWQFNVAGTSGAYRLKIYSTQTALEQRAAATQYVSHTLGITQVVAPLPLPDGSFIFDIHGFRAALFPYLVAMPTTTTPLTDAQGYDLGLVLAAIHTADLAHLPLPVEAFDTTLADELDAVISALSPAAAGTHPARRALAQLLLPVQDRIVEDAAQLRQTAAAAQAAKLPLVVCHGDLTPANILTGDKIFLIDWDDMRFAPKEIDLVHFRDDSPVMDGYRDATGMDTPNQQALCYARALQNAYDIAGFAGRALFQDLSAAQFEHNIAMLRNILRHRGIL